MPLQTIPQRGFYILLLLLLVTGAGLFFYIRSGEFSSKNNSINLISKEGVISLNNIFMLTLSFTILLGTVYPLFSGVLFNTKISVGAPFFQLYISSYNLSISDWNDF